MSGKLEELDPEVAEKASQLLIAATALGIELEITQTYRDFKQQAVIYAQGRTTPGEIITHAPPGYSWHNWRRAFDVAIVSFPGDLTPSNLYDGPWDAVGLLGERIGLVWGGRWKFPDRPHFEDIGGMTLAGLLKENPDGFA